MIEVNHNGLNNLGWAARHKIGHPWPGSAIVNIGARIGAHMPVALQSACVASKAPVSALMRCAARENVFQGVRINAVRTVPATTAMAAEPGKTPQQRNERVARQISIGRTAQPREVAAAIVLLTSPDASFVIGHDFGGRRGHHGLT